ncbi:MAG: hypothetical protein AB7G11_06380 [Phycisphaerales bacterium]
MNHYSNTRRIASALAVVALALAYSGCASESKTKTRTVVETPEQKTVHTDIHKEKVIDK